MKVTATELANDSKAVLDKVIQRGEKADVERHGQKIAEIQPAVGVSREELLHKLSKIKWTKKESEELRKAMDVSGVVGYAGGD